MSVADATRSEWKEGDVVDDGGGVGATSVGSEDGVAALVEEELSLR